MMSFIEDYHKVGRKIDFQGTLDGAPVEGWYRIEETWQEIVEGDYVGKGVECGRVKSAFGEFNLGRPEHGPDFHQTRALVVPGSFQATVRFTKMAWEEGPPRSARLVASWISAGKLHEHDGIA